MERALKSHVDVYDAHQSCVEKEGEATQRLEEKHNTMGMAR